MDLHYKKRPRPVQPSGAVSQTPRTERYIGLQVVAAAGHNAHMMSVHDFKVALPRVIKPRGGPGVELVTLGDAAKFVGAMSARRKARPHWKYAAELLLKAAETRKISDIEAATSQMERALRRDGWL
jgi:hypothetical protein